MNTKMRLNNVILKLTVSLVFMGCFFIAKSNTAYAAEIVINPAAADTQTEAQTLAEPQTQVAPVTVMPVSTYIATDTSHSLAIVLPDKLDVGNAELNLESVTGYTVYVYKDGTDVFNTGDKYREAGTGIVDLEELIRVAAVNFKNVSENICFKVTYWGKNAAGEFKEAKDASGNRVEWSSEILTVYRVSVSGNNVNAAAIYGFSGQNVILMPSLENGYSFKQWSDGNILNPRIEKISTNTSENAYVIEAEQPNVVINEDEGGYDVLPKTGESNSPFVFIFLSVFSVIGAFYVFFVMLLPSVCKLNKFDA